MSKRPFGRATNGWIASVRQASLFFSLTPCGSLGATGQLCGGRFAVATNCGGHESDSTCMCQRTARRERIGTCRS